MISSYVMKDYHIHPKRKQQFATSIQNTNEVESIRIYKTYVSNTEEVICTDHIDNKNSNMMLCYNK